jgi:hypothetical protein
MAQSQSRNSGEDSDRRDDAKEVPETAGETSGFELCRKETPREGGGADESAEKAQVCREILYCGAAKLVELGDNGVLRRKWESSRIYLISRGAPSARHCACYSRRLISQRGQ